MINPNFKTVPNSKKIKRYTNAETTETRVEIEEELELDEQENIKTRGPKLGYKISDFKAAAAAIRKMKLNGMEQDLLSLLKHRMQFDTGRIDFPPAQIAAELGMRREHLSRTKSKFIKAKIIIVRQDGNDYINSRVAWNGKDQWLCAEMRKSDPFLIVPEKKKRKPKSADILPFKKVNKA